MKRFSGLVILFKNYQKLSLYMTNLLLCNLTELTSIYLLLLIRGRVAGAAA